MPVMANFFGLADSDKSALSNPADHGYRRSDYTAFAGVDGRLSVQVVRLAKRIFVNCHRTNDLWPSSMRFRAPSETHPHTLELTPARHALRQAIARCDRA